MTQDCVTRETEPAVPPPVTPRCRDAPAPIRFAIGRCDLGAILVATTAGGIRAILLGDDPAALRHDLHERFVSSVIVEADAACAATMAAVVDFVDRPADGLALPLDIGGTAFQRRVWTVLRAIPAGTTVTYAAVARAIGQPAAARAVAAACAANPIAVAIPCHRVVRADGDLAGYRWGVARKQWLLASERTSS